MVPEGAPLHPIAAGDSGCLPRMPSMRSNLPMHAELTNNPLRAATFGTIVCVLLSALAGCTILQSQPGDTSGSFRRTARFQTQVEFMDEIDARPAKARHPVEAFADRTGYPASPQPRGHASSERAQPCIGGYLVQIAAYRSEERAQTTWGDLESRSPLLFQGRVKIVERADAGSGGVIYRLRAGYFSDTGEAKAFCVLLGFKGDTCLIIRM